MCLPALVLILNHQIREIAPQLAVLQFRNVRVFFPNRSIALGHVRVFVELLPSLPMRYEKWPGGCGSRSLLSAHPPDAAALTSARIPLRCPSFYQTPREPFSSECPTNRLFLSLSFSHM